MENARRYAWELPARPQLEFAIHNFHCRLGLVERGYILSFFVRPGRKPTLAKHNNPATNDGGATKTCGADEGAVELF